MIDVYRQVSSADGALRQDAPAMWKVESDVRTDLNPTEFDELIAGIEPAVEDIGGDVFEHYVVF